MKNWIDSNIVNKLKEYENIGFKKNDDGTLLIGKVPHVAPFAWFHIIFPPLLPESIILLQQHLKLEFSKELFYFYTHMNGIDLFSTSLSIYGQRKSYDRTNFHNPEPFDILTYNFENRPLGFKKDFLIIGGYSWDGSFIVLDIKCNKIRRVDRDSCKILNTWNTLEIYFLLEVNRLAALYDDNGKKINPNEPTIPLPDE